MATQWGEPCSEGALLAKASDQWRCAWCDTPRRGCKLELTVSLVMLQDFSTFAIVRNALSELRGAMQTTTAFSLLIDAYSADKDTEKAEWVQALQHMYHRAKTPIYSVVAKKDNAVKLYHELCRAAVTLQHSRLFWTVVLIFAKCTNAKMMDFVKSRLKILFDDGTTREWLSNAARQDLEALEVTGGLVSCTKLGNGKAGRRVADILVSLDFLSASDNREHLQYVK